VVSGQGRRSTLDIAADETSPARTQDVEVNLVGPRYFETLGIVLKALFTGKFEWLSLGIYILSGWMVIVAIRPIYHSLSAGGFVLLVSGGVAYTVGTAFYASKKIPYSHSIWHLWVLAGSVLHFFSVTTLLN
jgi:hemolysin III